MSQMDSSETEDDSTEYIKHPQEQDAYARNEQSARTFFAFLSFFIAVILLLIFINTPLDSLSKLLVLFGLIIFGMLGVLLLEKRRPPIHSFTPSRQDTTDEDEQDAQTVTTEVEQEEDDAELADTLTPFELLVQQALDSIPEEFHEQMHNMAVLVESEPDAETLKRVGTEEGWTLLGLYQGNPLTHWTHDHTLLPGRVTIYQRTIEESCNGDPARIREQVRRVVLHEVAHHFGMNHEEMPIWIR